MTIRRSKFLAMLMGGALCGAGVVTGCGSGVEQGGQAGALTGGKTAGKFVGKEDVVPEDTPSDDVAPVFGLRQQPRNVVVDETSDGPVTFLSFSAEARNDSSKIIGTNDLIVVRNDGAALPEVLRPLIDSFGRMSMGCTGTHIGNGLVAAAGHCFNARADMQTDVACGSTSIEWGYRADKPAYLVSKCTRIAAMQWNDDVDYAYFYVDQVPPVAAELDLSARPAVGTRLTIFGHPMRRPLEWSQYCTLQPSSEGGWGAGQFSHQCDTEGGNSGSAILNGDTGKIIGIHDGGLVPWNYGTYLLDTPILSVLGQDGGGDDDGDGDDGDADTPPKELSFGPFDNNEDLVLVTLGKAGEKVSFKVDSDTELGWDYVITTDAQGKTYRQSGKSVRSYGVATALTAPVKVRFVSDSSIKSASVRVFDILVSK